MQDSYSFENRSYDNDLYYPRDTVNYLVIGTQTEDTSSWTGNFPDGISVYKEGLTIDYLLPRDSTSSGATLSLSGANGSAEAKPVYLGDSSTQVSTQFPKNSVIRLTYLERNDLNSGEGAWKVSAYAPGPGGTVTNIATGVGLTGGPITETGTIKVKLKSETALLNEAISTPQETSDRIYPISIDSNGNLSVIVPWVDITNVKQDGISGGTANHYAVCSTSANTAEKTINISSGTISTLESGLRIIVKFTNSNTADNPKLNLNNLGAKNIYHNGSQITTNDSKYLLSNVVELIYDGAQWQFVGNYNYDRGAFVLNLNKNSSNQITASQTLNNTMIAINRGDIISAKIINYDGFTADLEYSKIDGSTIKLYYLNANQKYEYTFTTINNIDNITESILNIPAIQVVDWTVN